MTDNRGEAAHATASCCGTKRQFSSDWRQHSPWLMADFNKHDVIQMQPQGW
jgi:hypothetical protein